MKYCTATFSRVGNPYTFHYHPDITPLQLNDMVVVSAGGKMSFAQVTDTDVPEPEFDTQPILSVINAAQVRAVLAKEKK